MKWLTLWRKWWTSACLWLLTPKLEQTGLIAKVDGEGSALKYILKLEKELQEWKDRGLSWERLVRLHTDDIRGYWIPLVGRLKTQLQGSEWKDEEACDGVNIHHYEYGYTDGGRTVYYCTQCDKELPEPEDTGDGG